MVGNVELTACATFKITMCSAYASRADRGRFSSIVKTDYLLQIMSTRIEFWRAELQAAFIENSVNA